MENKQVDIATAREQADRDGRKAILFIPTSKCCMGCFQYSHSIQSTSSNEPNKGKRQSSPTDFLIYSPPFPVWKTLLVVQQDENVISVVSNYTPGYVAQSKNLNATRAGRRDNSLRFVDQAFYHFIRIAPSSVSTLISFKRYINGKNKWCRKECSSRYRKLREFYQR